MKKIAHSLFSPPPHWPTSCPQLIGFYGNLPETQPPPPSPPVSACVWKCWELQWCVCVCEDMTGILSFNSWLLWSSIVMKPVSAAAKLKLGMHTSTVAMENTVWNSSPSPNWHWKSYFTTDHKVSDMPTVAIFWQVIVLKISSTTELCSF